MALIYVCSCGWWIITDTPGKTKKCKSCDLPMNYGNGHELTLEIIEAITNRKEKAYEDEPSQVGSERGE